MSTVHDLEAVPTGGVELGRYRALEGVRALIAYGSGPMYYSPEPRDAVALVDVLVGHGNEYLVRSGFRDAAELNELAERYVQVAERWDVSPMEVDGLETIVALLSVEGDPPEAL
jgi:hypothetical protein